MCVCAPHAGGDDDEAGPELAVVAHARDGLQRLAQPCGSFVMPREVRYERSTGRAHTHNYIYGSSLPDPRTHPSRPQ